MPPSNTPSHALPISQPITDGTFILPLMPPKNTFKQDAAVNQPPRGSSSQLPSPLQRKVNYLEAIHKTIQQFNQLLKAEHFDRKTLQLFVFQLQKDFAFLRCFLFSSVRPFPISDFSVKNFNTSPLLNPKPNPTSTVLLHPCADEPKHRHSIPEGAVGPPRAKPNKSSKADFQSSPTHGKPLKLRCRTSHQEFPNWKNCLPMK